jgi:Kdo2-lipid IVA lauroyltransferase/acyltransferase
MELTFRTFFALAARLPLGVLHGIGGLLGWVAYLLSSSYRARLAENAALAGCGDAARSESIAHAGKMVAELPRVWLGKAIESRWEPRELVDQALANTEPNGKRRGLLFLTPHMGGFDWVARDYAEKFGAISPVTVLYRPPRQVWLREFMRQSRQRPGMHAVATDLSGVKAMLKALKTGGCVGLLPDQVPPEGMGEWLPFFGKPAYTMTLAARLIAQTRPTVLWVWGERLPGGRGFVVHVRPSAARDCADEARLALLNAELETVIREGPQQYMWGYNRYKQPRAEKGGE